MPTSGIGIVAMDNEGRHKHISLGAAYVNDFNFRGTILPMIDMLREICDNYHVVRCTQLVVTLPREEGRGVSDIGPGPIPFVPSSRQCRLGQMITLTRRQSDGTRVLQDSSIW